MAARDPAKAKLLVARRAVSDLASIETYSVEQWGKRTASRYLSDLEAGLERIRENPELLRCEPGFHPSLRFYSVNNHVFVCDVQPETIILLTVLHGSMDIPSRLLEMSPALSMEVEILHRKLRQSKER